MYSRSHSRDIRIPPNYGGSMFNSGRKEFTPVKDLTKKSPPPQPVHEELSPTFEEIPPEPQVQEEAEEQTVFEEKEEAEPVSRDVKEKPSLLSPLGNLGTEELLLLALALIIFQGGKEPDLALILLALLFIN